MKMQSSHWLALAIAVLVVAVGPTAGRAADARPNIVVFLADDLGFADVPWHGSPYHMPNLKALAQGGVKLEAHYVHPMCSPTRAAFMTGRYASRFGVTAAQNQRALPWNTVTLAAALKTAGYDTAITGKWHLGSLPEQGPQKFGFDHGYGSLAGGVGPYDHRYKEGPFTRAWHRDGKLIEEQGHVTDLIAREAVEWLESRGERPFFLYVPFTAIHVPMNEPEKWREANQHLSDPGQRLRAASATHLDDAVGRVLNVLDRKKLRDNTVVLFFGDNGAHSPQDNQGGPYPGEYEHYQVGNDNRPWRGHKSGVYEGGIRVAGLVSWPGKLNAREVQAPMHAVDWMPTFCQLAGAKPGDLKWDGQNMWPAISDPKVVVQDRTIYTAAPGFRAQAVRHGDWKLVVTQPGGNKKNKSGMRQVELFNLAADPAESKNLASEQPGKLAEMQQRLADISASDRDAVASD